MLREQQQKYLDDPANWHEDSDEDDADENEMTIEQQKTQQQQVLEEQLKVQQQLSSQELQRRLDRDATNRATWLAELVHKDKVPLTWDAEGGDRTLPTTGSTEDGLPSVIWTDEEKEERQFQPRPKVPHVPPPQDPQSQGLEQTNPNILD